MVMYNYALVREQRNTKFDLNNKKISLDTPREENILPRIILTPKYPTVNFPKLWYGTSEEAIMINTDNPIPNTHIVMQ